MDKIEQFIDLFVEVWRDGISGINISEIVIAILIFFAFLLLRGFFAKFIIKRLEKYVSKTTNRFDNSLVQSLKGPTKFFPIVIGFFIATSYVSLGDSTENFVDNANRTLITILIFWSIHQIIGPLSVLIKSREDLLLSHSSATFFASNLILPIVSVRSVTEITPLASKRLKQ